MEDRALLEDLEQLITRALDLLYKNDNTLICEKAACLKQGNGGYEYVGERAIVFRLAHYMQLLMYDHPAFIDLVVDCEYNRHLKECKKLPKYGTAIPDIIIHKRRNDENNWLVLECKTHWNGNTEEDKKKLREFTLPKDRQNDDTFKFGYKYGLSLVFEKKRENVKTTWFRNGEKYPAKEDKQ